jgi:hypothetical protein
MNEAETRAELIDLALAAAGWGDEWEFSRGGAESAERKNPSSGPVPNSATPRLRVNPPTP